MFLCYALIRGGHIQTRFGFRPNWKTIFSNEAKSETAVNNALQTDSASCKFVCFGSETVTVMTQVGYYNASARSGVGNLWPVRVFCAARVFNYDF